MALSQDETALLELILAKGQSYEDLAGLLDVPEDEVRTRARGALAELGGEDPDRHVALTDWILGQADPIGRADAARHVREDPDDNALARRIIESLRGIAPDAELPRLPGESRPSRLWRRAPTPTPTDAGTAPKKAERAPSRLSSLSSHQTRLIVGLGSAAVLLIAVVLAVTGAFGGGDEDDAPTADGGPTADVSPDDSASIPLQPAGDGDAAGVLTLGVAGESQAFLEIQAENLQPAPSDSAYLIWFMQDESSGFPFQELQVGNSGAVNERFVLPQELLPAALSSSTVDVWISPRSQLQKRVSDALESANVVEIPGERILTAPIQQIARAAGLGAEADGTEGGG